MIFLACKYSNASITPAVQNRVVMSSKLPLEIGKFVLVLYIQFIFWKNVTVEESLKLLILSYQYC